jgi:hypothetical protein
MAVRPVEPGNFGRQQHDAKLANASEGVELGLYCFLIFRKTSFLLRQLLACRVTDLFDLFEQHYNLRQLEHSGADLNRSGRRHLTAARTHRAFRASAMNMWREAVAVV